MFPDYSYEPCYLVGGARGNMSIFMFYSYFKISISVATLKGEIDLQFWKAYEDIDIYKIKLQFVKYKNGTEWKRKRNKFQSSLNVSKQAFT